MRPEEKTNVTRHHPAHHSHFAAGRRASDVAVQWRVGILSVRRPRTRLGDCAHSSSPWENLTRKQRRSSVIKRIVLALCISRAQVASRSVWGTKHLLAT